MRSGPQVRAMDTGDYLTRGEVLEILQIKLQTLYAYVSRGWIRSVPPAGTGRRLYDRRDVERMKTRAVARGGHAPAAAAAMRWGAPIIPSTITEITPAGPCYRGRAALSFVQARQSFERVAEWLWSAAPDAALPWRADQPALHFADARALHGRMPPARDLVRFLADVALNFSSRRDAPPLAEASRLIATMAHALSHLRNGPLRHPRRRGHSIAAAALSALGAAVTAETTAALDAALILCADHELAQATFVARIAASAGADMGECIAAAILTQTGLTVARSYEQAEDFLHGCRTAAQARRLFDREYKANRNPPGFNHPLYPDGDPRAGCLIGLARGLGTADPAADPLYLGLEIAAQRGCLPSLEVGLVLLAVALGLPTRSACGLFVVGRTAGWVAHILEQRASGALLRPRAGYLPGAARPDEAAIPPARHAFAKISPLARRVGSAPSPR